MNLPFSSWVSSVLGTTFSATSRAKFLKSEHRPGNDIELYQILLRSVSVLSGKAAGFAGQAAPCLQQKYYIADHSIREAVFDGTSQDINLILENIVFLELLRRGYEVTVGRTGDMDIDFVCDKRSEKLYVQVAYLLSIGRNGQPRVRHIWQYPRYFSEWAETVSSTEASAIFSWHRSGVEHEARHHVKRREVGLFVSRKSRHSGGIQKSLSDEQNSLMC